jgi:hypothetical protein
LRALIWSVDRAANCAEESAEACALLRAATLSVLSLLASRPASALVLMALTSSVEKVARLSEDRAPSCAEDRPAICVFVSAAAFAVPRPESAAAEIPEKAFALIS